jgi:hypothetical protein
VDQIIVVVFRYQVPIGFIQGPLQKLLNGKALGATLQLTRNVEISVEDVDVK